VVTNVLPAAPILITPSLVLEGGGTVDILTDTLRWVGPLTASAQVTITYQLDLPSYPIQPPFYAVAFLDDGTGAMWERPAWVVTEPRRSYLPLVGKSQP
jgi:hypothetical protein